MKPKKNEWQWECLFCHAAGNVTAADRAAAKRLASQAHAPIADRRGCTPGNGDKAISVLSKNPAAPKRKNDVSSHGFSGAKRKNDVSSHGFSGPRTPNPGIPRSTVPLVTDRALRYRAQRNPPAGPELCAYCGAAGRDIEHVDGLEENTAPENLLYSCRSCNTAKGVVFADEGLGRKTRQYNPRVDLKKTRAALKTAYGKLDKVLQSGKGAAAVRSRLQSLETHLLSLPRQVNPSPKKAGTLAQWKAAVSSLMGLGPWTPAGAIRTVQGTPQAKRAAFAQQLAKQRTKNPGAASSGAYFSAINILRGNQPGDAAKARALIDATPASDRSQWTRASWRTRKEVYGPSGRQTSFLDDVPF